jgi:type III pantothenate kinase
VLLGLNSYALLLPLSAIMQGNLILDFGNTRFKAALFQGEELKEQWIVKRNNLNDILETIANKSINACIIASVRSDDVGLEHELQHHFPTIRLNSSTALPIQNAYKTPETLGYDRIAAAIGGWQRFPEHHVLAVVAGTCITYNLITADGKFMGGAIAPGLQMRAKAMHHFTQRLPEVDLDGTLALPGYDTATSLRAGVITAAQAEIQGMQDFFSANYPELITVLGGGDATRLANGLKNDIFARPFLVREGLNCILNHHIASHLLQ